MWPSRNKWTLLSYTALEWKALEFGKFMLCCTYFDPTNCHPQHVTRNLVVYKTMQVTKTDYIVGNWIYQKQKIHTYISTFFIHFVENINNTILYVHCTYVLYSIVKDGDLKKTDAKKCTLLQIPCYHLLLLHEDTFSTRAWEFEILYFLI